MSRGFKMGISGNASRQKSDLCLHQEEIDGFDRASDDKQPRGIRPEQGGTRRKRGRLGEKEIGRRSLHSRELLRPASFSPGSPGLTLIPIRIRQNLEPGSPWPPSSFDVCWQLFQTLIASL